MKKLMTMIGVAALLATGCATTENGGMSEGDIALLMQDIRDVAHAGTVYALAENPQWRGNITLVRDQLNGLANTSDNVTFDSIVTTLQSLPIDELKSSEGVLLITTAKITLRRVGSNVELGNIKNVKQVAGALVAGMNEGLLYIPVIK